MTLFVVTFECPCASSNNVPSSPQTPKHSHPPENKDVARRKYMGSSVPCATRPVTVLGSVIPATLGSSQRVMLGRAPLALGEHDECIRAELDG